MKKEVSIEYAHIYTNNQIGDEQKLSLEVLGEVTKKYNKENTSLVVMVDDYSFPDPSFDYKMFTEWLAEQGFRPDLIIRESELIPACDEVLNLVRDGKLKSEISAYINTRKYPCSLFVATWYLVRLGYIKAEIFKEESVAAKLINILPLSFKPFEEKGFEIIRATQFKAVVDQIENKYFEGRLVA